MASGCGVSGGSPGRVGHVRVPNRDRIVTPSTSPTCVSQTSTTIGGHWIEDRDGQMGLLASPTFPEHKGTGDGFVLASHSFENLCGH